MLIIRLQRTGKKNSPEFRLILAEKASHATKKFQEKLGSYNPRTKVLLLQNKERLQYWIDQHVEVSATAHNLLVTKGHLEAPKKKAFSVPKKDATAEAKA